MFGMRRFESDGHECGPGGHRWGGRHGRHRRGHRFGGGHGAGGGDDIRAGRMLAQGDLRLILLALIAEQPRHGYEIIKLIEDKTEGWYSPSPGIVYPTLTLLEELGYVTAQTEGAKKLFTITDEGRADLKQNDELAKAVLDRLGAVGAHFERMRGRGGDRETGQRDTSVPQLVNAAFDNLRSATRERLDRDPEAEPKVVEILARAAADLRRS